MRFEKNGTAIATVADWRDIAPPRGKDRHWRAGRSAMELADAWCRSGSPCIPTEVQEILHSHPDISELTLLSGEPEMRLPFDDIAGEPRNADLVLLAEDARGRVAITVEAKADEPFGETLAVALATARKVKLDNPRSHRETRIDQLIAALMPANSAGTAGFAATRYQLLTAAAGTLAWARQVGADRAVLLVHEFTGPETDDRKIAANAKDLDAFVAQISAGRITSLEKGRLAGPITVPGSPLFEKPAALYVGKLSVAAASRSA
jgi:hypothetical protein